MDLLGHLPFFCIDHIHLYLATPIYFKFFGNFSKLMIDSRIAACYTYLLFSQQDVG